MNKRDYIANTFQTPNILIDKHLQDLDPYEFTLLSVIIRKTVGWGKTECGDHISLSQFLKICPNIKRRSIINKLQSLEEKGFVRVSKDKGHSNLYRLSDLFFGIAQSSAPDALPAQMGSAPGAPLSSESSASGAPVSSAPGAPTKPISIKPTNIKPKERSPQNGLRDVQIYFIESGIDDPLSNALKFFSHYEANGWVQGKGKPLKNWRAAPWASWNFIKTHSTLPVRLIDQNNEYHIERFPREKILNGLKSGKVSIEDELYLVCNYIKKTKEDIPKTILPTEVEVREILSRTFPGPS